MGKMNCDYVFMNVSASWNTVHIFSSVQKLQIISYWSNVEFKWTMPYSVSSTIPLSTLFCRVLYWFSLSLSELVAANEI